MTISSNQMRPSWPGGRVQVPPGVVIVCSVLFVAVWSTLNENVRYLAPTGTVTVLENFTQV